MHKKRRFLRGSGDAVGEQVVYPQVGSCGKLDIMISLKSNQNTYENNNPNNQRFRRIISSPYCPLRNGMARFSYLLT